MAFLDAEEHSTAAMLLAGVSEPDIAAVLRLDRDKLEARLDDMVTCLQTDRLEARIRAPRALGELR